MPKLPRLTAKEAEKLLLDAGFMQIRSQGSHRIYLKDNIRVVIPFHSGKILRKSSMRLIID
ncbi:MAG: type II toxin-antitoxin system HicA family toxin [Crocosphaera sp.]